MVKKTASPQIPFQQVVNALLDDTRIFPATHLHRFSDLTGEDLKAIQTVWAQVPANRRVSLLEDLEELQDADTLVNFDELAHWAANDPDARVRVLAMRLLMDSEQSAFVPKLRLLLLTDPEPMVRSAAASVLGKFIYLGEMDQFSEERLKELEELLLDIVRVGSENVDVRRHALESLGFSSRPEVPDLARAAFHDPQQPMLISALFAMGRSADNQYAPEVLSMLHSPYPEVQFEAVRAAGELELEDARDDLLRFLDDEDVDDDVRDAAIWSLSTIGGEGVREKFEEMLQNSDEETEDVSLVEDALDNLTFNESGNLFDMLDIDKDALASRLDVDLPAEDEDRDEDQDEDDIDEMDSQA